MATLLVQLSDRSWTTEALHHACALARQMQVTVTLLRLIPVRHASYLGTDLCSLSPSAQEEADLSEFGATAEDYGVECVVQPMQYLDELSALADAAELLDAVVVFARAPVRRRTWWNRLQMWSLKHRLAAFGSRLVTLEQPLRFGELNAASESASQPHHVVGVG
ncbi:MAG: hypothetical protein JNL42_22965 [Anaerolineae bacterium]|nr:hypothetical protein [Anaerolineae bacterium]